MAKTPRHTYSLSDDEEIRLQKVLGRLSLKSVGQLLQMLVSADAKRIEWICEGFKDIDRLF